MGTCTLNERLQSFAIGVCVAVVLMVVGWCAVTFTAVSSNSILTSASSRTDQRMVGRSVRPAKDHAGLLAWRQAAAE